MYLKCPSTKLPPLNGLQLSLWWDSFFEKHLSEGAAKVNQVRKEISELNFASSQLRTRDRCVGSTNSTSVLLCMPMMDVEGSSIATFFSEMSRLLDPSKVCQNLIWTNRKVLRLLNLRPQGSTAITVTRFFCFYFYELPMRQIFRLLK